MAGARVERVGSIFKRVEGLYKGKAVTRDQLPLWFDVYKAFPPHLEPTLSRAKPADKVRDLLYPEDYIKSDFMKRYEASGPLTNLLDERPKEGEPHLQRYVKYFVKFALRDDGMKADEIRSKVEHAMMQDGIVLKAKSTPETT